MLREVNLQSYLPPFLQDFIDYQLIAEAENPEFQLMFDESERLKNNQYILTADDKGLSRFEGFFNFNVEDDEDLEFRRSRLMSYWNDVYPYTYESLISQLRSLHGNNNFKLDPRFNTYELDIVTNLTRPGQVTELDYILGYMIPANIKVDTSNELYVESETVAYSAAGVAYVNIIEFTDAYEIVLNAVGKHNLAGGQTHTAAEEFTDAWQCQTEVSSNVGLAAAANNTINVETTDAYDNNLTIADERGIGSGIGHVQIIEIGAE